MRTSLRHFNTANNWSPQDSPLAQTYACASTTPTHPAIPSGCNKSTLHLTGGRGRAGQQHKPRDIDPGVSDLLRRPKSVGMKESYCLVCLCVFVCSCDWMIVFVLVQARCSFTRPYACMLEERDTTAPAIRVVDPVKKLGRRRFIYVCVIVCVCKCSGACARACVQLCGVPHPSVCTKAVKNEKLNRAESLRCDFHLPLFGRMVVFSRDHDPDQNLYNNSIHSSVHPRTPSVEEASYFLMGLLRLLQTHPTTYDCHIVPQYEYIWDQSGQRTCTHVLRYVGGVVEMII